ncbi:hypothetical protein [Dyadobacter frigoris]|uniref:Uncharacterized protein n=1 Tax=Dyadobacter frigoris TaxID=2576211 RepID=A0A4U6D348_9BACT|nr:hypothetical protein [Dyadobacter frigoris]TKT91729.1 hypothetical protein FDK13_15325 [Dyadobacter frigoris]
MSIKGLRTGSIFYLMLPNILFFYNWTNTSIAIIGIALLLFLFYIELKSIDFNDSSKITNKDILIVVLLSGLLTLFSGVTGFCYQTLDYWGHNAKFYDLASHNWPVRVPKHGAVVSYYFGYYTVPAILFKITGVFSESIIFIWTSLGLAIGIMWIYVVLNKRASFVILALCFGDFSHVLGTVLRAFSIKLYEQNDFGIENWSILENLFWVPNQVIPTLIIGGMFTYIFIKKIDFFLIVLPISLSFWWAVFPAFTSGILIGILGIRQILISNFNLQWRNIICRVFVPFLTCLPILIFFLSHNDTPVSGFLWQFKADFNNTLSEYSVNIGINVLAFLLSFHYLRTHDFPLINSSSFVVVVILILVLPLYRLGKVNDFLFRGMMPLLLIVGLYLLYPICQYSWRRILGLVRNSITGVAFILFLISSQFLGITRIYRAVSVNLVTAKLAQVSFKPVPYDFYPNVYEALCGKWSQQEANQYLGEADSFYEKYIARRP